MRGYGQPCPLAQAAEILTERWTPLVVRELLLGSHRFNDILRGVPTMSRTLLSQRLKALEDCGIVERRRVGKGWEYHLTAAGRELREVVDAMGSWGMRWARRDGLREDDFDVSFLMWDAQRNIDLAAIPIDTLVVRLHYRDAEDGLRTWWLRVSRREGVELFPGTAALEADLHVRTDVRTMTHIWRGDLSIEEAIEGRVLKLEGPADLVQAFPTWFLASDWSEVPRPG